MSNCQTWKISLRKLSLSVPHFLRNWLILRTVLFTSKNSEKNSGNMGNMKFREMGLKTGVGSKWMNNSQDNLNRLIFNGIRRAVTAGRQITNISVSMDPERHSDSSVEWKEVFFMVRIIYLFFNSDCKHNLSLTLKNREKTTVYKKSFKSNDFLCFVCFLVYWKRDYITCKGLQTTFFLLFLEVTEKVFLKG